MKLVALALSLAAACAPALAQRAEPLTAESLKDGKGVVLIDINWSRKWKCSGFQNAQLNRIAFDRMPVEKSGDDAAADLSIENPSALTASGFTTYAFVLDPGEYALTGMKIKVARSVSDVGYLDGKRSNLMKDGQPRGGSFDVKAGETVYIGHFFLDCYREPVLWRFYMDNRADFDKYLQSAGAKFPALPAGKAQFRLFKTKTLGEPFELP